MWGYSIGAAVSGVQHTLEERFQLEPSSQFGVRTTDEAGAYTHYFMHYTFAHEYSLEGIPMIDSRSGAWAFDKRQYQEWLPRHLRRPPHCALESTWTLWTLLHDAMTAHDGGECDGCSGSGEAWGNGSSKLMTFAEHDQTVRGRITGGDASAYAPSAEAAAIAIVGTGPWTLRDASGTVEGFYFLRGGQLHTPWGSAAWALATRDDVAADHQPAQLVVFLCGREKWTHTVRLESVALETDAGAPMTRLTLTSRAGDVQTGTLEVGSHRQPSSRTVLLAAFRGEEDAAEDVDGAARERRLLGTGPWMLGGQPAYLLAHGVVHWPRAGDASRNFGWWRAEDGGGGGAGIVLGGGNAAAVRGGAFASAAAELRLKAACWTLSAVDLPGVHATLVWSHPASRCFPTCSDSTHTLTASEHQAPGLARDVSSGQEFAWAGIPGMRFTFSAADGGGVLITPWGHGTWGLTSRPDVLVAEFAQKRHMLRFDDARTSFVSTRCDDGEVVHGRRQQR
jgi:hypothetical protein